MIQLEVNGKIVQLGTYVEKPIHFVKLTTQPMMRIQVPSHQIKAIHDYLWDLIARAEDEVLIEFNGILMSKEDVRKIL